jgi:hypothetical protein
MLENLPELAFLPLDKLVIHEWHDPQRTPPLMARLLASGVFRNPPIVAPLADGFDRYMVCDGANRVTALQALGYPHALVQIVAPGDGGLRLQNWNHVVWGLPSAELLAGLEQLDGLHLERTQGEERQPDLWGSCGLALVQLPAGEMYAVCSGSGQLLARVEQLNAVVNSYKERAQLDRTSAGVVESLRGIYADLCGLVVFPHFELDQVLGLAGAGYLLPAGITRFTVSPRALHLNYPLAELAADKPLRQKNTELQAFIQERIARKGVRYYAEATFLFDE